MLTLGLIVLRLARKSDNSMGRISSILMWSKASPRDRKGPMAASLARAVISEPENPDIVGVNFYFHGAEQKKYLPSVRVTRVSISASVRLCFCCWSSVFSCTALVAGSGKGIY